MPRTLVLMAVIGSAFFMAHLNVNTPADASDREEAGVLAGATFAWAPADRLEEAVVRDVEEFLPNDVTAWNQAMTMLPPGPRAIYATWLLEGEVRRGGFLRFLTATKGSLNDATLDGLRLLGADRHADLVRRAILLDETDRRYELHNLDDEFYSLGSLAQERIRFIQRHPEAFRTNGSVIGR